MKKSKLRQEAKGKPCQIRIPRVCNGNSETVVLAHINERRLLGVGAGMKPHDLFGAWACSACHDAVDGRTSGEYVWRELDKFLADAVFRTQNILLEEGKIGEL